MKIIIINGSPRKHGATAQILHMMEDRLMKQDNISTEYIDISNLTITPCSGCCSCYKTGKCYHNDDAEALSQRIEHADGIIIGSPTYASNISGQLKQLIDRGHFVIEQLLYGKYAVSVATGENYGSHDTSKILTQLLKYSGAWLSGKIVYNLPFNAKIENHRKLIYKINIVADRFYNDIHLKKNYPIQSLVHKIVFSVGIKPFVRKKNEAYQGVLDRWRRHRIISE